MRALCMITVRPGTIDAVVAMIKRKRRISRDVMIVTGRADICVMFQGMLDNINATVIEYKKIKDIVTTETLIEVEVNMGW